jgi:UDP-2,3-diacylglucosamine hydrolase
MHGDSLCIDDVSYQRYRRWVRNRFLQWCFLRLPLSIREKISDSIKRKSRQQKQHKTAMIMDVNQQEVIRVMRAYHVGLLIHGHTHRPRIHDLEAGLSSSRHRIVLGDWQDRPSFLRAEENELVLFDDRLDNGRSVLRVA